MKKFVLIFDLPREMGTVKVRTWRELQRMGAKMIQHSVWKFNNVQDLIKIALEIKNSGGKATILEEKILF